MFEKDLNVGFLLDFYGDVLTERRRDALDFYYNNDMSLSEIAEANGFGDISHFSHYYKKMRGVE